MSREIKFRTRVKAREKPVEERWHHVYKVGSDVYTDEIADEILRRSVGGESLLTICSDEHLPSETTVQTWMSQNYKGFNDRFNNAMALLAQHYIQDVIPIADDSSQDNLVIKTRYGDKTVCNGEWVNRSSLRVSARLRICKLLAPHVYDADFIAKKNEKTTSRPLEVKICLNDPDNSNDSDND